jgi:AcrR family transcriptional regulator
VPAGVGLGFAAVPNRARPLATSPAPEAPRARRSSLSREAIVEAAVQLADAEGLEAVSIRRVATALRARPMSLYTYVAAKDDLLALMAERIVAEAIVEDLPPDWREALTRIAQRSHAVFAAHPWVLEISGRRPDLGREALRHAEQLLRAVEPLRLAAADAWTVIYAVNDYTLGHALRVAHAAREPGVGYPAFEASEFPRLEAALSGAAGSLPGSAARDEATFAAGLELVLDGIERAFRR